MIILLKLFSVNSSPRSCPRATVNCHVFGIWFEFSNTPMSRNKSGRNQTEWWERSSKIKSFDALFAAGKPPLHQRSHDSSLWVTIQELVLRARSWKFVCCICLDVRWSLRLVRDQLPWIDLLWLTLLCDSSLFMTHYSVNLALMKFQIHFHVIW